MGHYVCGAKVVVLENIVYHFNGSVFNNSVFVTGVNHRQNIVLGYFNAVALADCLFKQKCKPLVQHDKREEQNFCRPSFMFSPVAFHKLCPFLSYLNPKNSSAFILQVFITSLTEMPLISATFSAIL